MFSKNKKLNICYITNSNESHTKFQLNRLIFDTQMTIKLLKIDEVKISNSVFWISNKRSVKIKPLLNSS